MHLKHIICTVTNDLNYDQRMQRICTSLSKSGYKVTLVGRLFEHSIPFNPETYACYRIPCSKDKGPQFYAQFNKLLYKYIISQKPDIICSIDLDTLLAGSFAKRKLNCKLVFDAHEWFSEVPELNGKFLKKEIWKRVESFGLKNTDLRYTVNQSLAKLFKEKLNYSFDVIRNVPVYAESQYDSTIAIDKLNLGKKIIFYQGALNEGRGLEEAISAMSLLSDNFELQLAGEGDLSSALRLQAYKSPAYDRIQFLGYLEPKELKKHTKNAFLGLNLLKSDSNNYYYSLANKFFDYMQVLVPSINMHFPEYELLLSASKTGLMIENLDPKGLAKTINSISDLDYSIMVDESEKSRKIQNWNKEEKKLIILYNSL